jgi:hypothetical protein
MEDDLVEIHSHEGTGVGGLFQKEERRPDDERY